MTNSQKGFTLIEAILIIAVVGLIGIIGWKVYDNSNKDKNKAPTTSQSDSTPAVATTADLKVAEDYLNKQDIDSQLDTAELDSALTE